MIRRLFPVLMSICVAVPAAAQCTGPNMIDAMTPSQLERLETAIAATPYPEGNIWRAERSGHAVHVVGTIHIPDPRLDAILAEAGPLLETSDLLILEVTTEQQLELQAKMTANPELGYITEGPTLIDLLGDETWAIAAAELQARGIPPFLAAKFKPWLLAMTLAIPACATDALVAGGQGLDARLEALAEAAGIPIATLDDIDGLLASLSSGSLDEQVELLRASLTMLGDQDGLIATTLDSYFAGRHREIWEFSRILTNDMARGSDAFDELETTLLDDRNRGWAAALPELLDGRNAVIAVGAAHLSGDTGILSTLERLGYTLTRL